ncbi:MAG: sialidase family protein [Terriglobia bacterium]
MKWSRRRFLEVAALGGGLMGGGSLTRAFFFPGGGEGFSQVPGVVVSHSPASTGIYLSSPSLVILPDGRYCATCDEFGPGSTEHTSGVTRVFISRDRGQTWQPLDKVQPAFWSTLFVHRKALYLIGSTNSRDSRLLIRKSSDWGQTWTTPADAGNGLLRPDVPVQTNAGSIIRGNGRLWFGSVFDLLGPRGWGTSFRFFVMSAPLKADLLKNSSWTYSTPIVSNPTFLQGGFHGLVEGTITTGPTGTPVTLYRVSYDEPQEKALVGRTCREGTILGFDPLRDFINFPGGCKKFIVRYDPASKLYWSLSNWVPKRHAGFRPDRTRNTLAMINSPDLYHWTIRTVVLHHPEVQFHAFQYVDFQFDGNDLVALSRTAYDDGLGGANSFHNANFITFHRFQNFRDLTPKDAPDGLADEILQWNSGG